MELTELTVTQVHQGLLKKEFSAVDLTQAFLFQIKKKDKQIFSFVNLERESALSRAKAVDDLITQGKTLPLLAGAPVAVKDNILTEGLKCTAGSKFLENYIAPYDATVIKKLKAEDCVILGKTNLDEFAMGSSTENSAFGVTHNPNDLERVPGGSSGGSAAAVAADMCVYALGSDTGGSIRQPACFCGVVGLKPTYGTVSRNGLIAFASSLDQIGPLAKTVEDAKIIFDVISGKDEMDSTSVEKENEVQASGIKLQDLKVGIPKEYFAKGINPEVDKVIKEAIKKYEQHGVKLEEISLPHTEYTLPAYYIISSSEASANLARYDGIKYGYSIIKDKKQKVDDLLDVYLKSREKGFGPEVRRRIMLGTYALSSGYHQAYYLQAQKVRVLIKQDFKKAFEKVDVIFTPTSPFTAFKIGEKIEDPLAMYLSDIYTVSANLAGLPAISIPCGKINNLPVGLQIIGKWFEEENIFTAGKALVA